MEDVLAPGCMFIPHVEVERWSKYYLDVHGIDASFEGLVIPAETEYQSRLVVMHESVSGNPRRLVAAYKRHCRGRWWQYPVDSYESVTGHDRLGTYAIRVADVPEAPDGFDEETQRNLSSADVRGRMWITATLPERFVDGDIYLLERSEHLDRKVSTVCAGSRFWDGGVLSVNFQEDGMVHVRYWGSSHASGTLRFRRVIA